MASDDEPRAIGWDAIDAALERIYGDREPMHYAAVLPAMLGGDDPLQGISVYKNLEPLPHFHYVTYGFSELYEKETDDSEVSGYGFELTFRLACAAADNEPPAWALNFLQNIARYVFSSGNPLSEHHHIDLNGPIALDEETEICAIALAEDPQLGEIESENGRVTFLQVVGLCADEYELIKDWDCGSMLQHIGQRCPLLITDLARKSILADPALGAEIRAQAEREGSSQAEVFVAKAEWAADGDSLSITLGATAVRNLTAMLKSRLLHDQPFAVYGEEQGILFEPDAQDGWTTDETLVIVSLSPDTVADMLVSLQAERGAYRWTRMPQVVVHVVPSEIKDPDGNVIQVIG